AVSIDRFFNPNSELQQCGVANLVLCRQDCCQDSDACDVAHSMTNTLTVVGHLRDHFKESLSFAQIKQEIDAGNPICTHISWSNNGGHIAVIGGYQEGSQIIAIYDPLYHYSELEYDNFLHSYQHEGHWDESYYLK
ncbi:MAG: C39 family peptidase, partial [Acetobacteraceae bacterium]|nr:C39 family peptidase [Acetobacteraceae bacterium]